MMAQRNAMAAATPTIPMANVTHGPSPMYGRASNTSPYQTAAATALAAIKARLIRTKASALDIGRTFHHSASPQFHRRTA